jgi:hypothetical protein
MAQRTDWPNHDWYGRPDDSSEYSWGPGLVPLAGKLRRRAKAAYTERCARRSNSHSATTSACAYERPDGDEATRPVVTPASVSADGRRAPARRPLNGPGAGVFVQAALSARAPSV